MYSRPCLFLWWLVAEEYFLCPTKICLALTRHAPEGDAYFGSHIEGDVQGNPRGK